MWAHRLTALRSPRPRSSGQGTTNRSAFPIRILHFADLVNRSDFVDNVVRNADPDRFSMAVCTMGRPSNIEDPHYAATSTPHWTLHGTARWQYPLVALRLAALLRRRRIDIVHAHHFEPCLIAAVAVTLNRRTRLVVGRHYSDAIYLHTSGWRRRLMLALEGWVNRRACRIVAPSGVITALLRQQGVDDDKVTLIPYAFDTDKFERVLPERVVAHRNQLALDGRFCVATFGRLYTDKGHRFVLDALPAALKAVPNLTYLIMGEGAERANLERQVADLGLTAVVTFLGWRRDVPELMAAVDVVLQPSLQEAFSQSMAEALFLGRPLIITDISGALEMVPDDSVGVVIPPGDPDAIADAIVRLASQPEMRSAMADAGRSRAYATFTIPAVIPLYEAVYASCSGVRPS